MTFRTPPASAAGMTFLQFITMRPTVPIRFELNLRGGISTGLESSEVLLQFGQDRGQLIVFGGELLISGD